MKLFKTMNTTTSAVIIEGGEALQTAARVCNKSLGILESMVDVAKAEQEAEAAEEKLEIEHKSALNVIRRKQEAADAEAKGKAKPKQ